MNLYSLYGSKKSLCSSVSSLCPLCNNSLIILNFLMLKKSEKISQRNTVKVSKLIYPYMPYMVKNQQETLKIHHHTHPLAAGNSHIHPPNTPSHHYNRDDR